MPTDRESARGYALLAVLWICVGIGGLTVLISAAAREAIQVSHNRVALTVATWNAAGCLAHAREVLAEAAAIANRPGSDGAEAAWNRVGETLQGSAPPSVFHCTLTAQPAGALLDVNASDEATLARLLRNAGMRGGQADSAAAALADWMDADDAARPSGAEREWYRANRRAVPSNRSFESVHELHLVRGLEAFPQLDSVLGVEPGPIALNAAVPEVLALLPGFTAEAVERVVGIRRGGSRVRSYAELPGLLSPDAGGAMERATARLLGATVLNPTAWVLTARSAAGTPAVTVVSEARVVGIGRGVVITRSRSWIE
jgi:general secretion pathway protein K